MKERKARRIIRVGMKKVENRKHTHDSSFNQVPTIGQDKKKRIPCIIKPVKGRCPDRCPRIVRKFSVMNVTECSGSAAKSSKWKKSRVILLCVR